MKNLAWVVRKLEELERKMNAQDAAVAEFTTLVRTRGDGFDQASVAADDRGERQRPVRRLAPWGVAGVPVVGSLAGFVKALGGAFGGMVFGIIAEKYAPQALAEGETSLYCKAGGTRVFLDKDGNVFIDAAAGKNVTVNGGTAKVSRIGDATTGHHHAAGGLMCPNTGTGISVAVTGATADATDTMAEGAPHLIA